MDNITNIIKTLGENAQIAAKELRSASTKIKNNALNAIANNINKNRAEILAANQQDMANGEKNNLDSALLDRLMLDAKRVDNIISSLRQISALADPIGEISNLKFQPSGIQVGKMRVPIGVIGIIYESRPNVTADAAALCLKSGNSAILRGGSEAINSNLALYKCIKQGLIDANLNHNCIQLVQTTQRELVIELVRASDYVDMIIPRGGKNLIKAISDSAKVPVIKHLDGICHTYIDKYADNDKAINVALNAKTYRYGICGATETLLIHKDADNVITKELIKQYTAEGVELRGCDKMQKLSNAIIKATEQDWDTEYLAPILSIRIVDSIAEAIEHIQKHSSNHTDAIITENSSRANMFLTQIDSSSVMVNTSTAFADGFEYGLGTEIGISTDKFHVRGPVGLEGLTSQKFIVFGNGNIRQIT